MGGDIVPVLRPRAKHQDDPDTTYNIWFRQPDGFYYDEIADYDPTASKVKSWFKNRFNNFKPEAEIVPIAMTREEYERHFSPAVGTSAAYADYTTKPPGGRRAWLKQKLKEQDPEPRGFSEIKHGSIMRNDAAINKESMVGWSKSNNARF